MVEAGEKKNWEARSVNCVSTTVPTLITKLYGGQSVTLKSGESTSASHKISGDKDTISNENFLLDGKETLSFTLPATFGLNNFIEIWALPENANKPVRYIKLIDLFPITSASV